jgi:hypothetical protein
MYRFEFGYANLVRLRRPKLLTSPWLAIWIRPKETIRQLVETNPTRQVIGLALLLGISLIFNEAVTQNAADRVSLSFIVGMSLIAGPAAGLIALYAGVAVLHWVSRQFGGKASPVELRAAVAWAALPNIVALLLKIPELQLFGPEFFSSSTPSLDANPKLAATLTGFAIAEGILALWAFILLVQCLSQVSRFSTWLGLITSIVPIFINGFVAARIVAAVLAVATS